MHFVKKFFANGSWLEIGFRSLKLSTLTKSRRKKPKATEKKKTSGTHKLKFYRFMHRWSVEPLNLYKIEKAILILEVFT
jgi:hypothetical protein